MSGADMLSEDARQDEVAALEQKFDELLPELKKHGARRFAQVVIDEAVACGCESCFGAIRGFRANADKASDALILILHSVRKKEHREMRITEAEFSDMLMGDVVSLTKDYGRAARFVDMNVRYVKAMTELVGLPDPEWRRYYDGVNVDKEEQIAAGEREISQRLELLADAPAFIKRVVKTVRANEALDPAMRNSQETIEKLARDLAGKMIAEGLSPEAVEIGITPEGLVLHGPAFDGGDDGNIQFAADYTGKTPQFH